MSMGIGKRYLVEMIKYTSGTIEECIEFMNKNKPDTEREFFELWPIVHIDKKGIVSVSKYQCALVRGDKARRKKND